MEQKNLVPGVFAREIRKGIFVERYYHNLAVVQAASLARKLDFLREFRIEIFYLENQNPSFWNRLKHVCHKGHGHFTKLALPLPFSCKVDAFHLLRRNPVKDNVLLVSEKELRHAERMLPELGKQTFTEMVRLRGYKVYDAEELAEKCGMEYGSFRRKMKKVTGYTPKEWVVKERAKDVEHYLKNTHLTLTEVAFTTGFSSTSNLNDFCRAYLLDTPGEIRKKWLETRKCTDSGI